MHPTPPSFPSPFFFFALMSATLSFIVAFSDIAIYLLPNWKSLPFNFPKQKLLNKWAGPDLRWWSHSNTIASNCSPRDGAPHRAHHWVATAAWCGLHWFSQAVKGDNCGAKCCRSWQDPFLDLSRAAAIEWVIPGSVHREADEFICTNIHAHTWAQEHTHTHTQIGRETKSATLHIKMIVSCFSQVVFFFLQP